MKLLIAVMAVLVLLTLALASGVLANVEGTDKSHGQGFYQHHPDSDGPVYRK